MSEPAADLERMLGELRRDRWMAHKLFFAHRHPELSCAAHRDMVGRIYSPATRLSIEGFRGMAKSTYLEEAAIIRAAFREFRNMVIVGSSYARACDRLASVKREFEMNDVLARIFGRLQGPVWQESKIVLSNGLCIQALGRDQSMTGMKYLDWRPDAALVDDVEDPEEVRTDAEREQTWGWFLKTFLPALDHPLFSWIRVLGTRRGVGSLPERLEKDGWPTVKYPVEYLDGDGKRAATWRSKFPLEVIDRMKATYRGDMHTWMQEYMCEASSETDRPFRNLRCEPRVRSWEAAFAMYDPARTTNRRSATTGKAVWSWIGSRLVFWEVAAERWLPDQIIEDMFATHARYGLTWIGFEEDGLNEWARQPIRAEMLRRRVMLPLLPVKAPRGKIPFIGGLQPYVAAGEVTFAGTPEMFRDAFDQFLSFPTGAIDAPNACAYALLLRPGAPVYEGFCEDHIVEDLEPLPGQPVYLAANSDGAVVTAMLVQRAEGEIRVIADWVREGSPADVVAEIHAEAALSGASRWEDRMVYGEGADRLKMPTAVRYLARLPIRWVVPAWHQEVWKNVGLVQAIRATGQAVQSAPGRMAGVPEDRGRVIVAERLAARRRGRPALFVGSAARWTLRGFAGGYARELGRRGTPEAQPDSGIYKLLMEGLEAFAAIGSAEDRPDTGQPIAHDRMGRAYETAMPAR